MASKKIPWFLTNAGRRLSFYATGAAATGSFCMFFVPNTFMVDKSQTIYQMYKGSKDVPVEPEILKLGDELMDSLGYHAHDKKLFTFFSAYGFDTMHIGSAYSKWGARIGVPSNFYSKVKEDLDAQNIRVKGEPVNLNSVAGETLLNSLIMSDKAKKFALGTKIYEANSWDLYNKSVSPAVCIIGYYALAQKMNRRLDAYTKPFLFRGIVYSLLSAFTVGMYFLIKDASTHYNEKKADETLSKLGVEMAEGGVEYYTKVLKRNKALRELMGSDGESVFSPSGDPNVLLRTPNVPVTQRLDLCKKTLKAIKENPALIQTFEIPTAASVRLGPIHMDSTPKSLQESSTFGNLLPSTKN